MRITGLASLNVHLIDRRVGKNGLNYINCFFTYLLQSSVVPLSASLYDLFSSSSFFSFLFTSFHYFLFLTIKSLLSFFRVVDVSSSCLTEVNPLQLKTTSLVPFAFGLSQLLSHHIFTVFVSFLIYLSRKRERIVGELYDKHFILICKDAYLCALFN